ncbi:hypothetical protein [Ruminococcus sp.]|uniref:hypothetical protein n=1 Tax=Ruminococcus sp. TaxID=41978 RepID=UPI0038657454
MMHARVVKKILLGVIAMLLVLISVFVTPMSIVAASISEESSSPDYSKTNVLDDLRHCTINGKPFNIADFPYDENKDIQVISFVEYCYSYKANQRDNYGLYVYVYNPKGLDLSKSQNFNKIQMAISFNGEGKPNDYYKFPLEFCSRVENGDYKNLFYKFKVVDKEVNGTHFADRVNSNERKYYVSGIELATYTSDNATDYPVGGTYVFTGYAKGYGPDPLASSTLDCDIEFLETISLNVKHTFYRSMTSALGAGHQNQLDTVYFSVPKKYIDTYGKLQRIKAEWYEYKTKEIVVTSNSDFANEVRKLLGVYAEESKDWYDIIPQRERLDSDYGLMVDWTMQEANLALWGWNVGEIFQVTQDPCPALYYLFEVDNIGEYDPYADLKDIGGVQSNALYEWIKTYNKSYKFGTLPIKEGNISADLFESDIDESRKLDSIYGKIQNGYSYYDFDADVDLQVLNSWSSTSPSFWDNWMNFGLGAAFSGGPNEESKTVAPIYILKESDLAGDDKEIAERLLVNIEDVDDIKAEYKNAKTLVSVTDEECEVVLFRFATSDYYSKPATILIDNGGFLWSDKTINDEAYVAQESVFFDFDIIQLTFQRDGVYTVIPVVSSPIDIVNDITPPTDHSEDAWWKILIAILILILLVYLLWPVLPQVISLIISIFRWIIKIILYPFKLIGKAFKKSRDKPKEDDIDTNTQ